MNSDEREERRGPTWTCALCGQFCESTGALKDHQCSAYTSYRIVKYGQGYEPSMWTRAGNGKWFWTSLTATGYWAEPESFSSGAVKGLHLLDTYTDAERAIERAKLINATGRVLNIADNR